MASGGDKEKEKEKEKETTRKPGKYATPEKRHSGAGEAHEPSGQGHRRTPSASAKSAVGILGRPPK